MLKLKIFSGVARDVQTDFNKWSAECDVIIQTAQYVSGDASGDRLVVFYVEKPDAALKRPSPILVPKMAVAGK